MVAGEMRLAPASVSPGLGMVFVLMAMSGLASGAGPVPGSVSGVTWFSKKYAGFHPENGWKDADGATMALSASDPVTVPVPASVSAPAAAPAPAPDICALVSLTP